MLPFWWDLAELEDAVDVEHEGDDDEDEDEAVDAAEKEQDEDVEDVVVVALFMHSMALESNNNRLPRQSHSRYNNTRTWSLLNGNGLQKKKEK